MGDIKFSGNEVVLEGSVLKVTAPDLQMNNPGRRGTATGPRRALVHDFQDGLTINWANDFPGGVTINGDVKVSKISGTHLRVGHHDLWLDNASRRSSTTGARRALVHDFSDGLTINWASDYPGGVTIRGKVSVPNELQVSKISGTNLRAGHHDLHLDNASRRSSTTGARRALVHDFSDGLTINWAGDYPGGVTIRGTVTCPQTLVVKSTDILQAINNMQTEIDQLKARVSDLEARVP